MTQSLRAEIAKLQRVLELLLDQPSAPEEVRRPGRPKGSGNRATSFNPEEFAPKKRTMSAEGRARIAAAQKKRWAAQKGSASDRTTRDTAPSTKRASKTLASKAPSKVAPATGRKSTTAGKRTGAPQGKGQSASAKPSAIAAARKNTARKSAAKKTDQTATKSSAAPAEPEVQTTA